MKVKETIAFIGETGEMCHSLIQKLASESYPLVLVTKTDHQFADIRRRIMDRISHADIEIIDCVKEGCWEADVIILTGTVNPEPALIEKMKEVAVQKILVYFTDSKKDTLFPGEEIKALQQSLKHTHVVQAMMNPAQEEITIRGAEGPSITVSDIFSRAGYNMVLLQGTNTGSSSLTLNQ